MVDRNLFDNSVERYGGPATDTESSYHFLCRAADDGWQNVRELLEDWYSHHPDPDDDLRSRFRQHELRQHISAWWELYNHALFRCLGYDVTVHPDLPDGTGHPDLLVTNGTTRMYVECVALFENRRGLGSADAQQWIFECINGTPHPDFMVDVDIESPGQRRPRGKHIRQQVLEWLNSLDYEAARAVRYTDDADTKVFAFGDWQVRLTANPVLPDHRGEPGRLIGRYPLSGVYVVTSVSDIRKLLKDKAAQCKGADAPLVIAIHNCSALADDDDIDKATFGSLSINWIDGVADSGWWSRNRDGYWDPGPSAKGATVAAVLFNEQLGPYNVADRLPHLWLNPWAIRPLEASLPFRITTAHDTGEVHIVAEAQRSAGDVLGLAVGWPGFAPRPPLPSFS